MADNIGNKAAHDYHLDIPAAQEGFYVKGSAHCDWGMKNRLGKMFDPRSGNTVMLAFDHGYIMGPTAGLERIDLVIPPLIESPADVRDGLRDWVTLVVRKDGRLIASGRGRLTTDGQGWHVLGITSDITTILSARVIASIWS